MQIWSSHQLEICKSSSCFSAPARILAKYKKPDPDIVKRKEYGPEDYTEHLQVVVEEMLLHVLCTCALLVKDGECIMNCTCSSDMKL